MLFDMQAPSSGSEGAAEAPAFLPASGSSSVYLDGIPAGGTSDISIELNARADLVKKPYSISMSMKYEDSSAAQYEAQSSLAIPVIQDARFEFSKIEIAPETVAVGEEANISCSLYNLGRVKMYNVKARFEGKMIESDEQFIGNLDSGATGMIDAIVTAKEETMDNTECKLILTYEDDAGNVRCRRPGRYGRYTGRTGGAADRNDLGSSRSCDRCCGCGNRAYYEEEKSKTSGSGRGGVV